MASLDEATRCPKCGNPGRETTKQSGAKRSTVFTYLCENEACKWYNTSWIVQVMSDGTIPDRKQGMKEFPDLDMFQQAMARRVLEDLEFDRTGQEPTT